MEAPKTAAAVAAQTYPLPKRLSERAQRLAGDKTRTVDAKLMAEAAAELGRLYLEIYNLASRCGIAALRMNNGSVIPLERIELAQAELKQIAAASFQAISGPQQ